MDSKDGNKKIFPLCCFYCKSELTVFMNGWQLCSGDFALLCVTCGSAYEDGSFCPRFHRKESGWCECVYCGKMLHSGCIMSLKNIRLMDFGGFCCLDCERDKYPIPGLNMPMNDYPDLWYTSGTQSMDYNPKDEPMTDVQLDKPKSPYKGETSTMAESSTGNSSNGTEAGDRKRRKPTTKNNNNTLKVDTKRN